MEKIILIRYSEIHLKGRNIGFFESRLYSNIKSAIAGFTCNLSKIRGRYIVDTYDVDSEKQIVEKISKVFGVHSLSTAYVIETSLDNIKMAANDCVNFDGTFKVVTNRADKRFPMSSPEVSAYVGGFILENHPHLKVDVVFPTNLINIDIRENKKTYVFDNTYKGVGGLPVGCSGSTILLLSGGIDSPVAGYMMAKRGLSLHGLHFHSFPYTSDLAKQKVLDLAVKLKEYTGHISVSVVSFTKVQEEINSKCDSSFMITIMRRIMMRIAQKLSYGEHTGAITTGESLGQVASQTIESINATNAVVSIPVFRPLIGMDKSEIIEIARKIGTYETSILPYEDCCTVFLPKNPIIKPKIEDVLKQEAKLDIDFLISQALETVEKIIL